MNALAIGLYAQTACIWEATARKPGNVHRYADFHDAGYLDFLLSAAAIAPVLERAGQQQVGLTVLEGVRATRQVTTTNTNLGILLLLAPLAAVPADFELRTGLLGVLDGLDVEDARAVYQAIRLAVPAGLGQVAEQDVAAEPTLSLRSIMELAADRDLVARQYANGFREVFEEGVPALRQALEQQAPLEEAIIRCHLYLMAVCPDSLIARKRGLAEAQEASRRARRVLEEYPANAGAALTELDAWLRAEGHSRNPGTTADLVTACLFVALRMGVLRLPLCGPWSRDTVDPGPTSILAVTAADPRSPEAVELMRALSQELARRYDFADDGSGNFEPGDALVPRSGFVLGRVNGRAVACGAFRSLESDVCEIKRMFVAPEHRGRGYARAVLAELERMAAGMGYAFARLETGDRQPEAIRLYERIGYRRIPNFGIYVGSKRSLCFEKQLRTQGDRAVPGTSSPEVT